MKNKIAIGLLTFFLMLVAFWFGYSQIKVENKMSVSFDVMADGVSHSIRCWLGNDNIYYVFVPSYAELSELSVNVETFRDVYLGGALLEDGASCGNYELNQTYYFDYDENSHENLQQLMFVKSENVATIYIDTRSGSMSHVYEQKGNSEEGQIVVYDSNGNVNYNGQLNAIKGRGNSTWSQHEKKPYSIELESAADLLGMGAAKKWILLANAGDESNMRNKIVYDFAAEIGLEYSPDTEWTDVYLNGEYAGLYLLSERIEASSERVDIELSSEAEQSGFIVSMEWLLKLQEKDVPYFLTQQEQAIRIIEPNILADSQMDWIFNDIQAAENAILAEDGADPESGSYYTDLIDVDSWGRKYLIEEVFANGDACKNSQYFYQKTGAPGEKIYAGPVWDYDYSMAAMKFVEPCCLIANREYASYDRYTPWFHALYQKEEFYECIVEIYRNDYMPELEVLLQETIPGYADRIRSASAVNRIRWSNAISIDMDTECQNIIEFLDARTNFLYDVWVNKKEFCYIRVDTVDDGYLFYAIEPGTFFDKLPAMENTPYADFVGWYDKRTGELYDMTQAEYEDFEIYAEWIYKDIQS